MSIRWKHVRVVAVWLAGAVATVAVVPLLGQFFVSLADEQGWYAHPSARVHAVLSALTAITASPWFHWLGGATIGFAGGVWLDAIARKRDIQPDLEVTFDPTNPGGRFVYSVKFRDDVHLSLSMVGNPPLEDLAYTVYCCRVTNRTNRTLRQVNARIFPRGENLSFVFSSKTSCDLHPGASDYVKVWTVYHTSPIGEDGGAKHTRDIVISGLNATRALKGIEFNLSETPALKLLD